MAWAAPGVTPPAGDRPVTAGWTAGTQGVFVLHEPAAGGEHGPAPGPAHRLHPLEAEPGPLQQPLPLLRRAVASGPEREPAQVAQREVEAGGPEAAISRRHAVIDHGKVGGAKGMFSVVGGKLSTFRPLAGDVIEAVTGRRPKRWLAAPPAGWRERLLGLDLDYPARRHLRRYGGDAAAVIELGREVLCPHAPGFEGEVRFAARHEQALTVGDVLLRRTGIGWARCRGLCCHERVAELLAEELGWSPAERDRATATYAAEVAYHLPVEGTA